MGKKHRLNLIQKVERFALTSGLIRKQAAADFGIGFSILSKWIQQNRKNQKMIDYRFPGGTPPSSLPAKNREVQVR